MRAVETGAVLLAAWSVRSGRPGPQPRVASCSDTTEPSPLSHEILNGKPFTYLDDAPLEERRTRAGLTPRQIGFAVAVLIYVAVKILLLPGLFIGTPFLHRVPEAWAVVLGITVPSAAIMV